MHRVPERGLAAILLRNGLPLHSGVRMVNGARRKPLNRQAVCFRCDNSLVK
jgi:hypothetical protein